MTLTLQEYSLSLHPDKTRLIEFGRHAAARREQCGLGKPETFTFLGFTLICGRTRKGQFQILRKTRSDRMRATLTKVKDELRRRMHLPIPEQGKWLQQVTTGFFAYHAVPTNFHALAAFREHIADLWRRALRTRSQKDATTWQRARVLKDRWLPLAASGEALFCIGISESEAGSAVTHMRARLTADGDHPSIEGYRLLGERAFRLR